MDAFLSALPGRRASFVAAAFFSGGIHLTLLFGFPGRPPVEFPTEAVNTKEPPPIRTTLDQFLPPKPEVVKDAPPVEESNNAKSQVRATIEEPPVRYDPGSVTVTYKYTPEVRPDPASTLTTIPSGQEIEWRGGSKDPIVDLDQLDKRPEAVAQMAPAYPFEARNAHIEGVVMVRFIVTKDGTVESASIAATPHGVFNEPALAAVRKWKFRAGMKNGVKVATRMEIPLAFRITE